MEKIKNVLDKIKFPLEFLVSLIFAIALIDFAITKAYDGYWSLKDLIILGITCVLIIGLIIYIYVKNKKDVSKIFVSFLIPIGMLYVFFMAPSQVPDETSHIRRSIEISNGGFLGRTEVQIPEDFQECTWINKYSTIKELVMDKTDYKNVVTVKNIANGNFPTAYTFSSIAFMISRVFSLNAIVAIYLARLFNYIFFLIAIYICMKKIPFGKKIVGVLAFMPMILQQCTSISADSIIIPLSLLFVSYTLYLRYAENKIKKYEYVIYVLLLVLLAPLKYVYVLFTGLSLLIFNNKNIEKKQKILLIISIIIIPILLCGVWYAVKVGGELTSNEFEVGDNLIQPNSSEQISFILHNPIKYAKILINHVWNNASTYINGAIVSPLGWLNINVTPIIIYMFLIILVVSPMLEENKVELNTLEKTWMLLISLCMCVLILTVYYLVGANVGGSDIYGCQGRYFIPILIIPLLCISKKQNYYKINKINIILPVLLLILNLCVVKLIFTSFV